MDASGDIGQANYDKMKTFVSDTVGGLDVGGNTQVGVVTYDRRIRDTINLNEYSSVTALQSDILGFRYRGGTPTNTHNALSYVRRLILATRYGDRSNISNVVVLVTHEDPSFPTEVSVKYRFDRQMR